MADIAHQIIQARQAGYSDAEIITHLSGDQTLGGQIARARQAGHSDTDILSHLINPANVMSSEASIRADNRSGFQRDLQTAGNRAREAFGASIAHDAPQIAAAVLGGDFGGAAAGGFNALMGAGAAGIGAFTHWGREPDTPQIAAIQQQTNQQHPFFGDPRHIPTERETQDFAGSVAVNAMAPIAAEAGLRGVRALPARAPAARPAVRPAPLQITRQMTPTAPVVSQAEQVAARALRRNIENGGQTEAEFRAHLQTNPGALPVHANPGLARLGGVVAQGGGPGAQPIIASIENWRMNVPGHVNDALATAHGQPRGLNFIEDMAAQQASKTKAANQGMQAFGQDQVTLSSDVAEALDNARGGIDISLKGNRMNPDPAVRAQASRLQAALDASRPKAAGQPFAPLTVSVEDAQTISRWLKTHADSGFSATSDGAAKMLAPAYRDLGKAVRGEAAAQHPGYADWLKNYAEASDLQAAQEIGFKGLTGNRLENSPAGQKAALAALDGSPEAIQAAHAKGTVEAALFAASRTGDISAVRSLLRGADGRAQLEMALGDKAGPLIDSFENLMAAHNANASITGNSLTYGRAALSQAEREAEATLMDRITQVAAELPHSPAGAAVWAGKKALKAIASQDRSVIGNPEANAIVGRALANPQAAIDLLDKTTPPPPQPKAPVSIAAPQPSNAMAPPKQVPRRAPAAWRGYPAVPGSHARQGEQY